MDTNFEKDNKLSLLRVFSSRHTRNCWIAIAIGVIAIVGLVWINSAYKLVAVNVGKTECKGTSFSVLTFNVNAGDSLNFTKERQEKLRNIIRREKPSIVCFQEFDFKNVERIKPLLDSLYGPCYVLNSIDSMWRPMFYTAYPIHNFHRHRCEGEIDTTGFDLKARKEYEALHKQIFVMSADFEVAPGKWVRVFSGHLRSSAYSTARRSMGRDRNWLSGIPLYFKNYDIGKRIRDYEARNVRQFIENSRAEGMTVILAGDLNDWCGSDCLNTLQGSGDNEMKDAWWEGGNGFGFTFCGWHLRLRLDHILYSRELQLQDVRVIDSNMSDHKPLMVRFGI